MLGPGLSQHNTVSQLIVILSGLIVCANSALIIGNTTSTRQTQERLEQEQQRQQQNQDQDNINSVENHYQVTSKMVGLDLHQRKSSDWPVPNASGLKTGVKPVNSSDHLTKLEEVDETQEQEQEQEQDGDEGEKEGPSQEDSGTFGAGQSEAGEEDNSPKLTKALSDLAGTGQARKAHQANEISTGMSQFSHVADSKLNELLNPKPNKYSKELVALVENATEPDVGGNWRTSGCHTTSVRASPTIMAGLGLKRDSTRTVGASANNRGQPGRLKRGLRARPKFSRKIFKKITPTKVLVGAHLGSWGYKQYKNWTAVANGTTVAPPISLNASAGPTPRLSPPPLVATTALPPTGSNGSSLLAGGAPEQGSSGGNATTAAAAEDQSSNGSFISDVAQLFLGLRPMGSPGDTANVTSATAAASRVAVLAAGP